jgi:hypothetical protein
MRISIPFGEETLLNYYVANYSILLRIYTIL